MVGWKGVIEDGKGLNGKTLKITVPPLLRAQGVQGSGVGVGVGGVCMCM